MIPLDQTATFNSIKGNNQSGRAPEKPKARSLLEVAWKQPMAVLFTKKIIWLVPNDLVRFQLQKELLEPYDPSLESNSGETSSSAPSSPLSFKPTLMTFSSLEGYLAAELETPEIDDLHRSLILNRLTEPLAQVLWPQGVGEPGPTGIKSLAEDVADGLDRLKLAGLNWDQVSHLPPPNLSGPLADLGRAYDRILGELGLADRFDRRRMVLEKLRDGHRFLTLRGVEEIVCRWSQRLSPFETDFITALAHSHQVKLTLKTPAWVRDESIDHGAGFDLLRSIRQIERCEEPKLWLDFAENAYGPAAPALAFAADALLAPTSYHHCPPDPSGQLQIVRTSSAYTEVEEAARRLKSLQSQPHNLALVVPDLDKYGSLIDDVGRRFGLAFYFRRGETLADQGPVKAILELMALFSSNWERSRVLNLFQNPYFNLALPKPGYLNRLTLEAGITDCRAGGGFEENLAKIAAQKSDTGQAAEAGRLLALLGKLKAARNHLAHCPDWTKFIVGLKKLLNDLGWPGPLDQAPQTPENIYGADLAASFAFQEELNRLAQALKSPYAPEVSWNNFSMWLKFILSQRRLAYDPNPDGRIRVLNYYDLHGGLFDEIFFLGLNERVFPHITPENGWWPPEFVSETAKIIGRPLWSSQADSYRQQELMLAAGLGQARRRVWLFYHAGDESGKTALPSPLLTAIKELWPDGTGGSLVQEERVPWSAVKPLAQAAGEDEMWNALISLTPGQWPPGLAQSNDLKLAWEELQRRRDQWHKMRSGANLEPLSLTKWLEKLPQATQGAQSGPLLRPSFLGTFAECPFKFWWQEVLKMRADGEPIEEWPTTEEGTLLHSVLEKFFQNRLGPDNTPGQPWPGQANFDECRAEILTILDQELASQASSKPLGRKPLWELRREKLPHFLESWLEREFESEKSNRPWLVEWSFGDNIGPKPGGPAWELPVGDRESLFFKGRIDRVDKTDDGLEITDYKLRKLPASSFNFEETPAKLWPIMIYAQAASAALNQPVVPVLEALAPASSKHYLKGPEADHRQASDDSDWLNFNSQLVQAWQSLKRGLFPPTDAPEACAYCPFSLACPKSDQET